MKPEKGKKASGSVAFGVAITFVALTGLALVGGSTGSRAAGPREQLKVEASPASSNERIPAPIRGDDADQVARQKLPGHPELDLQLD